MILAGYRHHGIPLELAKILGWHRIDMTVLKPRSRTISIRLSEEEYLSLKRLCSVTGARSVSDLTRDAMRVAINGSNRHDRLDLRLDEFRAQLKRLDRRIEQLVEGITSMRAGNGE